jgi:isopentenyl diphosphate isomerase/L-lactate dehydrogenase-like FMN-dependent dehydrogenase
VDLPPTLSDFERAAAEALDEGPLDYFAGGGGDEITLRDNEAAWRRLAIRPRVLVDVAGVDTRTTVLGREQTHPIIVAPTAFHRLAHPEGEQATARGAAAAGATYCLSSLATATPAEVAAAAPEGRRWFQLYVFKDRGVFDALVEAAVEHGYEALVVTADLPVLGVRERELRSGYAIDAADLVPEVHGGTLPLTDIGLLIDPTLSWKDVERLAETSGLPVLVKGVLTAQDARRASDHGLAGVIVSNHGGRQLDTVLAGADALPEVVEEVGDRLDVLVDGGVRRGTDVLKALALGARAVMVGRPVVWGLAVGGQQGVQAVLDLLRGELEIALALAGVPRAGDLDASSIQPAPWASRVPFRA